jgi:large exoprotein involved in heme utilization and adhesion
MNVPNRVALTFVVLSVSGTALAAAVPAAPDSGGPRNWVVTATSGAVNLREEASPGARVITMPDGNERYEIPDAVVLGG